MAERAPSKVTLEQLVQQGYGSVEFRSCPQAIHGWFQAVTNPNCPWCAADDAALELAQHSDIPEPCVMTHTPPFDFAVCGTHDETFPLGGACKWEGKTSIADVLQDEADGQRARAASAEEACERAEQDLRAERLAGDVILAMAREVIAGARVSTHYAGCEEVHVACFAARVAEALCSEPDQRPHSPMLLLDEIRVCSDCVNSAGHLVAYELAHPLRATLKSSTERARESNHVIGKFGLCGDLGADGYPIVHKMYLESPHQESGPVS